MRKKSWSRSQGGRGQFGLHRLLAPRQGSGSRLAASATRLGGGVDVWSLLHEY